jgi:hypothetical protein
VNNSVRCRVPIVLHFVSPCTDTGKPELVQNEPDSEVTEDSNSSFGGWNVTYTDPHPIQLKRLSIGSLGSCPNIRIYGVYPVEECGVALYMNVSSGRYSGHFAFLSGINVLNL